MRKIDNNVLGSYPVKVTETAEGDIQHVRLDDQVSTAAESALAVTNSNQPLAANADRRGGYVMNVGANIAYYSYSGTATTNDFPLRPGESLDFVMGRNGPIFTGAIGFISNVAGTTLKVVQV